LVGRVGSRRIPVRKQRRWFGVARRKKGSSSGRERERVGSVCSSVQCVEEKEKRRESTRPGAERQTALVCLTGRRGGRSGRLPDVEESRGGQRRRRGRWKEEQSDAWSKVQRGAEQQGGAQDRAGVAACGRGGNREKPGIGEDKEDPVVKSRKLRGLSVKLG
jgi:hypothetical protein